MQILELYLLAYFIMMLISTAHMMFNWQVLGYGGYSSLEEVKNLGMNVEAYKKTAPWQPLYNLFVFGGLSAILLQGEPPLTLLYYGLGWLLLSAVTDPILWVLIPHPWRVSWQSFYRNHMPWLPLCYLCALVSPFAALLF